MQNVRMGSLSSLSSTWIWHFDSNPGDRSQLQKLALAEGQNLLKQRRKTLGAVCTRDN